MKNIYFAGAISAKDYDTSGHTQIIKELEKYGDITNQENYDTTTTRLNAEEIFMRMEKQLETSTIMIADISTPSHGVGREIAYAQFERKIPVLCLYQADKAPSPVLEGNIDIDVFPYQTIDDIKKILKTYFTKRL